MTSPMEPTDGSDALDPAAMLALQERQASRVDDIFTRPTIAIVYIWGVAWTVGFLALWSASDENPWFTTPPTVAGWLFGILMVGGIVSSSIIGSRMSRGIQGAQQVQGTMYGIAWAIGCTAAAVFGGALFSAGMAPELSAIFYPAIYSLVVGLLYLAGGAVWRDRVMYGMGIWIIVVGMAAPFFGSPGNALIMAIAGGGGFLVYATFLEATRRRRAHRSAA
ncbi:hypothetical protein ITJ66_07780 [Plantibacter sp. VKM Ac-2885]|uniref:hypothetical protein n=1 Tax=Plantibacter TaxID=190323 RepID=UPI00188B5F24|nr:MULTISPECIES: hypothetical protein [Plantibacter]MBF4512386.1 hypothetical protein [Plantibacter sp. VKM Ac-2885]